MDGIDIRDISSPRCVKHWHGAAGRFPVFHTIRNNIAYGMPDATLEQITAALKPRKSTILS